MARTLTSFPSKVVVSKQDTYVGAFRWIQSDLVYFEREDHNLTCYSEIDTNPNHWGFFWVKDLPENLVSVKTNAGDIAISGTKALWLPPFSLIEWKISPGQFHWHGYLSNQPVSTLGPNEAVCYDLTGVRVPETTSEIFTFLQQKQPMFSLERNSNPPSICKNLKLAIQNGYKDDLFIGDVALELGVTHEYLVRAFRKAFGLTPVYLRSRLRVFSAILPLLRGEDVAKVAFDSGFSDLGRFTKQFTKFMKVPPVQFQLSRRGQYE